MSTKLEHILRQLGLTESEVSTYITCLRRGPSAVSDLAASTGLTRQSIYNATGQLVEKGLMLMEPRPGEGRSVFIAESPKNLLGCMNRKRVEMEMLADNLKSLIPELEMEAGGDKPVVRTMEGYDGLKESIATIIESGGKGGYEMVDFAALRKVLLPEEIEPLHQLVKKMPRSEVAGIYTRDVSPQMMELMPKSVKLPDTDAGFGSVIGAFGDKIIMVSFREKMHTIIIEDRSLAKALRVLFRHTSEHVAETEQVREKEAV